MALINSILDRSVPGVYVTEDTFGAFPAGIATYSTVYMLSRQYHQPLLTFYQYSLFCQKLFLTPE
ncbi:hypothetical protein [Floridanema aerugineum]|uniref:Uncharacterized protein n=1 Tax=Floridaenema aerugineum BLCC-F46 TaxID=3153654 RepID=A0ABV4X2E0_9CYAN